MLKKERFSKMLVIAGTSVVLVSLVNLITLLIPFDLNNPKWPYLASMEVAGASFFPILGILILIGGVYLCSASKEKGCRCAVWAERLSAVFCSLFFVFLFSTIIFYSLSISGLVNDAKTQINSEVEKVKNQIMMMAQQNPQINPENVQKGMKNLEERAQQEIKKAKTDITKNSVRIIFSLLVYAFVYLISAVYLFKNSVLGKENCDC